MRRRSGSDVLPSLAALPAGLLLTFCCFSLLPLLTAGRELGRAVRPVVTLELVTLPPAPPALPKRPPPAPPPPPVVEKKPPPPAPPLRPPERIVEPVREAPPAQEVLDPVPLLPAAGGEPLAVLPPPSVSSVEATPTVETTGAGEVAIAEVQAERPAPVPVPFFRLTTPPRFVHRETPVYPPAMKVIGRTGTVEVQILIDDEGQVRAVEVLTSAGNEFDEAAVLAVSASTFEPGEVNGNPVAVHYRTKVRFLLK